MLIEEEINERLDVFISNLKDISRSYSQKLIDDGFVLVNDKKVKSSYKLKKDDILEIDIPELKEISLKKQDIKIDIVYEDKYLAIINKYAGMVVHPSKGHEENTLVNAILYQIKDLSGINGDLRPGIVHRLDKDTSGLIIIAKDDKTHNILTDMFKERKIKKIYYAIVKGKLNKDEGKIISNIARDENDRKKMCVSDNRGKLAITNYKVIDKNDNFSLVRLGLETGRTHQIRVHLSKYFFPILGDSVYGRKDSYERQMLHSYSLEFNHPITNENLFVKGNFHKDFLKALKDTKLNFKESYND